MTDRAELLELIQKLAVVHGEVTLSSGQRADYYIDLRRITLHRQAAPLVGRVLRELTADWDYQAAGGLTWCQPIGTAILHASNGAVDAFVVRKAEKQHGLQQRVEGPSVAGRRVLAVEDVSTTGSSILTAVEALREAGAEVVGTALILDRGAGETIRAAGLECRSAFTLADLGLG